MKRCYTLLDKVHPPRKGHVLRNALWVYILKKCGKSVDNQILMR